MYGGGVEAIKRGENQMQLYRGYKIENNNGQWVVSKDNEVICICTCETECLDTIDRIKKTGSI